MPQKLTRAFPVFIQDTLTKLDGETRLGIVSAYVSVLGNIDHGYDVITNGAFTKTIAERAHKIRVLDNHNMRSVLDAIAKLVTIREVSQAELPPDLVARYPDATGALYVEFQFMLDEPTDKSAQIFRRIDSGVVDEYSIGFEIIKANYREVETDEGVRQIRFITEVKLYEFSPVVFAMNDATITVGVKGEDDPIDPPSLPDVEDAPLETPVLKAFRMSESDTKMCGKCKMFAAVTDERGYCKLHDMAVDRKMICDDFEPAKEAVTLRMGMRERLLEAMGDMMRYYVENGVMEDADYERLEAMFDSLADTVLDLMPDDITERELPDETYTLPKNRDVADEAEPLKALTSDEPNDPLAQSDEIQRRIAEIRRLQDIQRIKTVRNKHHA